MGFFGNLFKGLAYTYATTFKKLLLDAGISISESNIILDDVSIDLIFLVSSGKLSVPLHTKNAILGYLKSNYPKVHNPRETAIFIYLYSIELYGGTYPSDFQLEKDLKVFEEVFGY